ncbi:MAG TPA: hypothetical protein VKO18_11710 [Terriglobia bacterium]|nr:hypothetical protein [Terriglobia bacterium]
MTRRSDHYSDAAQARDGLAAFCSTEAAIAIGWVMKKWFEAT